jgi:hypothetical protein
MHEQAERLTQALDVFKLSDANATLLPSRSQQPHYLSLN